MSIFDIALDHERARAEALNPYRLTEREQRLAGLLGEGLTAADAMARLDLGEEEFDRCYGAITAKLGAASDAQLRHVIQTLTREPTQRPQFVDIDDFRPGFGQAGPAASPDDDVIFAK